MATTRLLFLTIQIGTTTASSDSEYESSLMNIIYENFIFGPVNKFLFKSMACTLIVSYHVLYFK